MSSLTRRMQRKPLRGRADYERSPEPVKMLPGGGYLVLHATRGWRRVCAARAALWARN